MLAKSVPNFCARNADYIRTGQRIYSIAPARGYCAKSVRKHFRQGCFLCAQAFGKSFCPAGKHKKTPPASLARGVFILFINHYFDNAENSLSADNFTVAINCRVGHAIQLNKDNAGQGIASVSRGSRCSPSCIYPITAIEFRKNIRCAGRTIHKNTISLGVKIGNSSYTKCLKTIDGIGGSQCCAAACILDNIKRRTHPGISLVGSIDFVPGIHPGYCQQQTA